MYIYGLKINKNGELDFINGNVYPDGLQQIIILTATEFDTGEPLEQGTQLISL